MLRHIISNVNKIHPIPTIFKANLNSVAALPEKWDILTAVCLERRPIITQELTNLEKDYKQYLADIELDRSLKCDFELRHELEIKQIELLKKGSVDDLDINLKQTAQDFADASLEELNQFKLAERTTDADKSNDTKSLNRKLDKHLVLVLNQQLGKDKFYLLPQGRRESGETLRQTAERVLKQSCGPDIKAQFYGNAPCGFYKYKYPKEVSKNGDSIGAKVFIYFARHMKGQLSKKDFKWLDRKELEQTLPRNYRQSIAQLLIDE